MKKILGFLMAAMMLIVMAACGSSSNGGDGKGTNEENGDAVATGEVIKLKVGHTLSDTSHYQEGLMKFKEELEKRSNGQFEVEVFANGALGGERDMIEGLQIGSVDLVLTSTGPMSGFVEEITVVDLPFLFRDAAHAHAVLDGEIGQDLLNKLEPSGLKGLAWWENGFRNVTNNVRAIEKPEDLKGLKLRTMENEIHMDSFRQLGVDPTPMAFTELFTALQQGVVDGNENPVPVIYSSRFYEVQKYLTMTRHFYNPSILLTSTSFYDKLTPELQEVLAEVAIEGGNFERSVVERMDNEYLDALEENGMEVIRDIDTAPFIEAVQPVYEKYEGVFGKELIEKIRDYQ